MLKMKEKRKTVKEWYVRENTCNKRVTGGRLIIRVSIAKIGSQ